MTTPQQPLDGYGTLTSDAAAMRLREATRNFLRALEEYHDLPRSFQTWRERNPYSNRGGGHVKRDDHAE